jgi:hypothetical protein
MKAHYFLTGALVALIGLLTGCAGHEYYTGNVCRSDYRCMKDQMFQYRQQAAALNMMADRYTREAQELGQDSEQAKKNQAMAQKFSQQAEEADHLAWEYERQLPHNSY